MVTATMNTAAMTIGRFTGHDFADARRTGTATVERCERRGPVGFNGFAPLTSVVRG